MAQKTLKAVTGITSLFQDGREIKQVEFEQQIDPTLAGQAYGMRAEVQTGSALFLLYDDGWRIAKLSD